MEGPSLPAAVALPSHCPRLGRALTIVVSLLLIAALGACSPSADGSTSPAGSGSGSAVTGTQISGLIAFKGIFRLKGAISKHAPFISYPGAASATSSCPDLAARGTGAPAGEKPHFRIPSPAPDSNVYLVASLAPYRGPGTYGRAAFLGGGRANIGVGTSGYNPLAPKAIVSATINADGSGDFTFSRAAAVYPAKPGLSGSVSWTCAR